jgi:hypothetical protein
VASDERLADRIRELVPDDAGATEKRMFGGLSVNRGVSSARSLPAKP